MMNVWNGSDQLVHFDGNWPARERSLVEMAVLKAEQALDLPVPDGLLGRPWICSVHQNGEGTEYVARRVNLGPTIEASSASALIEHLRNKLGHRTNGRA